MNYITITIIIHRAQTPEIRLGSPEVEMVSWSTGAFPQTGLLLRAVTSLWKWRACCPACETAVKCALPYLCC